MKFFLFFISRGVYINVFVFRYDLGEILIIMNDKKKNCKIIVLKCLFDILLSVLFIVIL